MPDSSKVISQYILATVKKSRAKTKPFYLEAEICTRFGIARRTARSYLKALVEAGSLAYTYEFGCTFLVPSILVPFEISPRTMIVPAGMSPPETGHDIYVRMRHGSSFGSGDHPTTQICARAMEYALRDLPGRRAVKSILDIGTGSGILLIIGLMLGIPGGIGTDIDPCSLAEAKENLRLNGLEKRASIVSQGVESLSAPAHMVCANLRYPTLLGLADDVSRLTKEKAVVVLSGIREEECSGLKNRYCAVGFRCLREARRQGWAGLLLERKYDTS